MMNMDEIFENFKFESENFFVKKLIVSDKIKKTFSDSMDIIFDITKTMDSTKGIIAFSTKYGQGKSFFFDVVNHRNRRIIGKNKFVKTTAKDLCQIFTSAGSNEDAQQKVLDFISVQNLFIDDIGDEGEKKTFKHYSNELNVIRFVLLKRYEFWIEKGWKTYGTTNLTIEEIATNYDGRVADRLIQMCYWFDFQFLEKGSFRQNEETRKLTNEEIEKNWGKFKRVEVVETLDREKYFNELINEPDEYFEKTDISFWTFVKNYLIEKGLLDPKEFNNITDEKIEASKLFLKRDVRQTKSIELKHSPGLIRSNAINEAIAKIKKNDALNVAENSIARLKFMELRQNKHIFK
ncbi:ATPase [Flavobacterium phage vB_FspS_tant8-1]|uniref:ATPase n=1 Tax=Flavobacterium phage vB_FspS_tant8-1 TaxID=2686278 RepID=A0A6B9LV91_9CAUD|nr:ATPase [Flavobacterium phage vB_FspS_tant8-1]QHB40939.1 ATPase [Flavobacterium phage vB_FspS_tant8-1]